MPPTNRRLLLSCLTLFISACVCLSLTSLVWAAYLLLF